MAFITLCDYAGCAGLPIDFDSCAVKAIVEVLAWDDFDDDSMTTRMLRGVEIARKLEDYDTFNETMEEIVCIFFTREETKLFIDKALGKCEDETAEQHKLLVESFISIFTNETCVCGI